MSRAAASPAGPGLSAVSPSTMLRTIRRSLLPDLRCPAPAPASTLPPRWLLLTMENILPSDLGHLSRLNSVTRKECWQRSSTASRLSRDTSSPRMVSP